VQEIWYVVAGSGEMWRRRGDRSWTVRLQPDVCLTIPLGTVFQFRADPDAQPLRVVAVTMPPWPTGSRSEARTEEGAWPPTGPGPVRKVDDLGGDLNLRR
jgi:mannose-6-phosphate isomerase-like protein (cupin superfamily)